MKVRVCGIACLGFMLTGLQAAFAQERIELESIYVKGNKEFPQTLYIVPWQDVKARDRQEQPLVLHSLFGDLFDPLHQAEGSGEPKSRTQGRAVR